MRLPSLLNYQLALQDPRTAFRNVDVLRGGTTVLNAQGMPSVASGGFAATFAVHSVDGHRFAVRCFHKQGHDDRRLRERYEHIHRFVTTHPQLRFLIGAVYQADGIVVNGTGFPMVWMRWAAGEMLGVWIEDWIEDPGRDPAAIETVRIAIANAVVALRAAGAAHGDLQHGNIVVGEDFSITLIDYDGMYLDAFRGTPLQAIEQGHRNYQHPGRGGRFDRGIDTFAAAVVDVSLRALRYQPSLWDDFGGTGENLIFTARDFIDPENSPVFAALARIRGVAEHAARLRRACRTDYDHVEAVLAGGAVTAPTAGTFALVSGEIVAGSDRAQLLAREGETVTVYGKVRFATVTKGRQSRDVALINLGDYKNGDFTIVAYDDVARRLYADYGNPNPYGKRPMRKLHGWQVAITGTIVIFVNKGVHVPQIELVRAGLLRNLSDQQIVALTIPPPQVPPTPPKSTRVPEIAATPTVAPPPVPVAAKSVEPSVDRSAEEARRQARLSEMYKNFSATPTSVSPSPTTPPRRNPQPTPAAPTALGQSSAPSSPHIPAPRSARPRPSPLPAAPASPSPPPTQRPPSTPFRPVVPGPPQGYTHDPWSQPVAYPRRAGRSGHRGLALWLLVILVVLIVLILVACGSSTPNPASATVAMGAGPTTGLDGSCCWTAQYETTHAESVAESRAVALVTPLWVRWQ
ncbi:hypothetical protein [Nocardia sp. NBC_01327]|uniref:hypothetical protein n=1 Tax=Nocardia sp. NBC_01327 TaxID=2903593 RepID=UPI002E11028E|nr:hypothetical protein OG326_14960 [Nocardia sp. NBC_01327]